MKALALSLMALVLTPLLLAQDLTPESKLKNCYTGSPMLEINDVCPNGVYTQKMYDRDMSEIAQGTQALPSSQPAGIQDNSTEQVAATTAPGTYSKFCAYRSPSGVQYRPCDTGEVSNYVVPHYIDHFVTSMDLLKLKLEMEYTKTRYELLSKKYLYKEQYYHQLFPNPEFAYEKQYSFSQIPNNKDARTEISEKNSENDSQEDSIEPANNNSDAVTNS
ncbi:MAG: hypothetical protein H6621_03085 [Halobacteriovoraceae bacterium]|nr:hypothetical protein [Halobacteriovoraceae bacterium]MCB9094030.1 hypothetical protein [Halobacteriovoraceae bacterium]